MKRIRNAEHISPKTSPHKDTPFPPAFDADESDIMTIELRIANDQPYTSYLCNFWQVIILAIIINTPARDQSVSECPIIVSFEETKNAQAANVKEKLTPWIRRKVFKLNTSDHLLVFNSSLRKYIKKGIDAIVDPCILHQVIRIALLVENKLTKGPTDPPPIPTPKTVIIDITERALFRSF